jgi:YD repeat-containing protein
VRYAYDTDDNMTAVTDLVDATRSLAYGYDAVDRLVRVTAASGAVRQTDYLYDANGNRVSEELRAVAGQANADTVRTLTKVTGTNRLSSVQTPSGLRTITYDGRGNTAGEARGGGVAVTATYDAYARLTGYARTGDPSQTTIYNGMDDRVAVTSGSDVRRYVYDQDNRLIGDYGTSAADVKGEFGWLMPEAANDNRYDGRDGAGGRIRNGDDLAAIPQR